MNMDMEGRLNSLLGGWRYLRQRLRAADRERDDDRERAKSFLI